MQEMKNKIQKLQEINTKDTHFEFEYHFKYSVGKINLSIGFVCARVNVRNFIYINNRTDVLTLIRN